MDKDKWIKPYISDQLLHNVVILLIDIYPKEWKLVSTYISSTQTFIMTSLLIVKIWKCHKCPSTSEWINKVWCIRTMAYLFTIEKTGVLIKCYFVNKPSFYWCVYIHAFLPHHQPLCPLVYLSPSSLFSSGASGYLLMSLIFASVSCCPVSCLLCKHPVFVFTHNTMWNKPDTKDPIFYYFIYKKG